jgi:hypothetical protein
MLGPVKAALMRPLVIALAVLGTASPAAADLARCQDMQRAYGALIDQQAGDTYFAHINRMLQLCPLPPDGASYAAWIRYDECKKQPQNAATANAASQQVANRYTRRLNALTAELSQNNCP